MGLHTGAEMTQEHLSIENPTPALAIAHNAGNLENSALHCTALCKQINTLKTGFFPKVSADLNLLVGASLVTISFADLARLVLGNQDLFNLANFRDFCSYFELFAFLLKSSCRFEAPVSEETVTQ